MNSYDDEDVFGVMPPDDGARWPAYVAAAVVLLIMLMPLL